MLRPLLTPLLDATGIISSSSRRSGHLFVSRSVTSRRYFVSELSVPLSFKSRQLARWRPAAAAAATCASEA